MEEGDRTFYIIWGVTICLFGIMGALWILHYHLIALLVLFEGIGIINRIYAKENNLMLYGSYISMLIGILILGILIGISYKFTIIFFIIAIGIIVLWHGLRGEKK